MFKWNILLTLFVYGCSPSSTFSVYSQVSLSRNESLIVGGEVVSFQDPLQYNIAMIVSEDINNEFICTGIVLNQKTVITAAHCVQEIDKEDLSVYFGRSLKRRPPDGFKFKVMDVEVSKNYDHQDPLSNSDLALLRLDHEMPKEYKAPLFTMLTDSKIQKLILYGYGQALNFRGELDEDSMGILRNTIVHVYRQDDLQGVFWINQSSSQGICEGDSGGPAFSWIHGEYQVVGLHANVLPLEWIDKQTSEIKSYLLNESEKYHQEDFCKSSSRLIMLSRHLNWIKTSNRILDEREREARQSPFSPVKEIFNNWLDNL